MLDWPGLVDSPFIPEPGKIYRIDSQCMKCIEPIQGGEVGVPVGARMAHREPRERTGYSITVCDHWRLILGLTSSNIIFSAKLICSYPLLYTSYPFRQPWRFNAVLHFKHCMYTMSSSRFLVVIPSYTNQSQNNTSCHQFWLPYCSLKHAGQ